MRRLSFSFVPTCTIWRIHSVWKSTKMAYQKLKSYSLARFQNSPLGVSRWLFFSRGYLPLMKLVKMRIFSFKIPASLMCLVIFQHCCIQFFFSAERKRNEWSRGKVLDYWIHFYQLNGLLGISGVSSVSSGSSVSVRSVRSFNFDTFSNFQNVNLVHKNHLTRTTVTFLFFFSTFQVELVWLC